MSAAAAPTIQEAGQALRAGRTTARALAEAALTRIDALDGQVHAFASVDRAGALIQADAADAALHRGEDRGPLHGVPYALKDIYDVAGQRTGCGSALRDRHVAAADSTVAMHLRAAGAVLLGKLATFEFALGGPAHDTPYPATRNPWDLRRDPGGSSSGSGAAIAAGYVALAPGSCTTGSIRGPAAWCGAVGLKPSFGRVSRHGVFPLASSLDHCGPLTRCVYDAAVALGAMAGHDPADPASLDAPVPDYLAGLDDGVTGLRVGVPRHFFADNPNLAPDARDAIERVLAWLRAGGAAVRDVALPDVVQFLACGRVLQTAESYAVHRATLRTRLREYGAVGARRFSLGAVVNAADYLATKTLQTRLRAAVDATFETVDLLVTAISLDTAPILTDGTAPVAYNLQASPFNVTGHPAISIPIGLDRAGLPLAVQVVGRTLDEALVLRAARFLENASGWLTIPLPEPA